MIASRDDRGSSPAARGSAADNHRAASGGNRFALLATPANVTYVSGWEAPIGVGPIWEIAASLPLAFALVSAADGAGSLITPDVYASGAASKGWFADVTAFDSLGHFEELDPPASFKEALRSTLRRSGLEGATAVLGVEPSLPLIAHEVITSDFPKLELRDASPALEQARRRKTEREIGLLREAARVASAAQTRLRELAASAPPPSRAWTCGSSCWGPWSTRPHAT